MSVPDPANGSHSLDFSLQNIMKRHLNRRLYLINRACLDPKPLPSLEHSGVYPKRTDAYPSTCRPAFVTWLFKKRSVEKKTTQQKRRHRGNRTSDLENVKNQMEWL
ncbi:hypothetical protein XPA_002978 [Xanthoria parietina]